MSYEPTNWKSGDVVTSAKLNKLEQGVADAGGGVFPVIVTITDVEQMKGTSSHTPAEILNAVNERLLPVLFETSTNIVLTPPVSVESTETRFNDIGSGYTFYIREDGSVDMST